MSPAEIADILEQRHEGRCEKVDLAEEYDAWCADHGYDPADDDVFDEWTWGPFTLHPANAAEGWKRA